MVIKTFLTILEQTLRYKNISKIKLNFACSFYEKKYFCTFERSVVLYIISNKLL